MPIEGARGNFQDSAFAQGKAQLTSTEIERLKALTTPKTNRYIKEDPTPKQAAFLLLNNREAFYGGAAGGGKSSALLAAALQYVDEPRYSALLLRRTYADLILPGALMDRARTWLSDTDAQWVEKEKTWLFPSGARVAFGYLEAEKDKYRYQSAEFQFVGFDELTQFSETQYKYMFSRLRRLKSSETPIRMRAASNPGGEGHNWVMQRFIVEGPAKKRIFIPASLEDNPFLDQESYDEALQELDPVTREQLRRGNWYVTRKGNMFKSEWFEIVEAYQLPTMHRFVRYWDFASTEASKKNRDPDWTTGLLLGERHGIYYVMDIQRFRCNPANTEARIRATAERDGKSVSIFLEQEPGSSGVTAIDHYCRNVLKGYSVRGIKPTGSKALRANPASAAASQGRIKLVRGIWINDFIDELELFPEGQHDDQVDALSGAFNQVGSALLLTMLPEGIGESESYWEVG